MLYKQVEEGEQPEPNRAKLIKERYAWYILLYNLAGDISNYFKISEMNMVDIMGYLDVSEKHHRLEKIENQENRVW